MDTLRRLGRLASEIEIEKRKKEKYRKKSMWEAALIYKRIKKLTAAAERAEFARSSSSKNRIGTGGYVAQRNGRAQLVA